MHPNAFAKPGPIAPPISPAHNTVNAGQTAILTQPLNYAVYVNKGGTLDVNTTLLRGSTLIDNGGTINIQQPDPTTDAGTISIGDGAVLNIDGPRFLGPSETIDMYCNEPNENAPTINILNMQPENNVGANIGSAWDAVGSEIIAQQGTFAIPNQGLDLSVWDLGPNQWGTYSLFNSYDQWANYSHTYTQSIYGFGTDPAIAFSPLNG